MKQSLPEISLEGVMGWLRENLLLVLTFSGDLMLISFGVFPLHMFIYVCFCCHFMTFFVIVVTVVVLGVFVELLLMLLLNLVFGILL